MQNWYSGGYQPSVPPSHSQFAKLAVENPMVVMSAAARVIIAFFAIDTEFSLKCLRRRLYRTGVSVPEGRTGVLKRA